MHPALAAVTRSAQIRLDLRYIYGCENPLLHVLGVEVCGGLSLRWGFVGLWGFRGTLDVECWVLGVRRRARETYRKVTDCTDKKDQEDVE